MPDRPFPKEMLDLMPPDIREIFEGMNVQMWTPGDKVDAVVCARVRPASDNSWVVPGSIQVACFKCRHRIWLSPATRQTWKLMPGTPLVCLECATQENEKEQSKP